MSKTSIMKQIKIMRPWKSTAGVPRHASRRAPAILRGQHPEKYQWDKCINRQYIKIAITHSIKIDILG
jgi:hypothetical protein